MTVPAAIAGQLVDAKNIAVHKTVRLSIDVPAEKGAEIIAAFGWPSMAAPVPVAVARMQMPAGEPEPTKVVPINNGKRSWRELTATMQASIRCTEPPFWRFLRERGYDVNDEVAAADQVRKICGIRSRRELTSDNTAAAFWDRTEREYQGWLRTPQYED